MADGTPRLNATSGCDKYKSDGRRSEYAPALVERAGAVAVVAVGALMILMCRGNRLTTAFDTCRAWRSQTYEEFSVCPSTERSD